MADGAAGERVPNGGGGSGGSGTGGGNWDWRTIGVLFCQGNFRAIFDNLFPGNLLPHSPEVLYNYWNLAFFLEAVEYFAAPTLMSYLRQISTVLHFLSQQWEAHFYRYMTGYYHMVIEEYYRSRYLYTMALRNPASTGLYQLRPPALLPGGRGMPSGPPMPGSRVMLGGGIAGQGMPGAGHMLSSQVIPGEQGNPGQQGMRNGQVLPGQQGVPGRQGMPGQQGVPGQQGMPGQQGVPGRQGMPGQQGLPGRQGMPGQQAVPGRQGMPGQQGVPGRQGMQGQQGVPGRGPRIFSHL